MKQEWKGPLRVGAVLFGLYLAIHYWEKLTALAGLALGAGFPLVLGAVIAYAVNILMSMYEGWYFPNSKSPGVAGSRRPVCLLLAYASLIALVVLIVRMILPELIQSFTLLLQELTPLLRQLSVKLNDLSPDQLAALSGLFAADGTVNWHELATKTVNFLLVGLGGVMGSLMSLISTTISAAFTAIVSVIFSIYLLMGKENLSRQIAKVLKTYLKPSWYSRLLYFLETLHNCFRRFVVGQCTEAIILGLLCMGGMMLFQFPYASMVGTLIGFTALIPVAGAYIGAGVGAFLIFTASPIKALLFLVFISVHEASSPNWLLTWMNPLCLIVPLTVYIRKARKITGWFHLYNITATTIFFIIAATGVQSINPALLLLAGCGLIRSINFTLNATSKDR